MLGLPRQAPGGGSQAVARRRHVSGLVRRVRGEMDRAGYGRGIEKGPLLRAAQSAQTKEYSRQRRLLAGADSVNGGLARQRPLASFSPQICLALLALHGPALGLLLFGAGIG